MQGTVFQLKALNSPCFTCYYGHKSHGVIVDALNPNAWVECSCQKQDNPDTNRDAIYVVAAVGNHMQATKIRDLIGDS